MGGERLGLVGGLTANRPVIASLLLAFGATALAATGAAEWRAAGRSSGPIADVLIALLALPLAPLALAALAPRQALLRGAFVIATGVVFLSIDALAIGVPSVSAPDRRLLGGAFFLLTFLAAAEPLCGPLGRLGSLPAATALVGAMGGSGLLMADGAQFGEITRNLALGVSFGVAVGFSAVGDHASLFAAGETNRRAAGLAARRGGALALFATLIAGVSVASEMASGVRSVDDLNLFWSIGVAVLAVVTALIATVSGLTLRHVTEGYALAENRRLQRNRKYWRPLRQWLAPRTAFAAIAVAAILCVVGLFELAKAPGLGDWVLTGAAGAVAGVIFFSFRAALFLWAIGAATTFFAAWIGSLLGLAPLAPAAQSAAHAFALVCFAQLALAWRDARSPRLNARETMEAGLSAGVARYLLSMSAGAAIFYAAGVAGGAPALMAGAGHIACLGVIGLISAPPLMTALSAMSGRDAY